MTTLRDFIYGLSASRPLQDIQYKTHIVVGGNHADYIILDPSNNQTVIQKALNKVRDKGGGKVLLRAGIYNLASSITMTSNTTLEGDSPESTILYGSKNFSGITPAAMRQAMIVNAGGLTSKSNFTYVDSNIQVRNLTIDGNTTEQTGKLAGICFQYLSDCRVENVNFRNCGQAGAKESQSIWLRNNNRGIIRNCRENNCDGFTISISEDCVMDSCWSYNSTSEGFFIGANKRVKCINCYTFNGEGAGFSFTGSGLELFDCEAINCYAEGHGNSGTFFAGFSIGQDAYRVKISNCSATLNYGPGVKADRSVSLQVNGGLFWNNGVHTAGNWAGIQLQNVTKNSFISGAEIWDDRLEGSKTQKYGVTILHSGSVGCQLINTYIHDNATAVTNIVPTDTIIRGCRGIADAN